jgi:uncharacterized protein (DUF2062 family)
MRQSCSSYLVIAQFYHLWFHFDLISGRVAVKVTLDLSKIRWHSLLHPMVLGATPVSVLTAGIIVLVFAMILWRLTRRASVPLSSSV